MLAINLGGCLVPLAIATYQVFRLYEMGLHYFLGCAVAVVANIIICKLTARPVENIGITIPALLPAHVAAILALLLVPDQAPSVAFTAGVLGPLIGADLLHLKEIRKTGAPVASIGGAGILTALYFRALPILCWHRMSSIMRLPSQFFASFYLLSLLKTNPF